MKLEDIGVLFSCGLMSILFFLLIIIQAMKGNFIVVMFLLCYGGFLLYALKAIYEINKK